MAKRKAGSAKKLQHESKLNSLDEEAATAEEREDMKAKLPDNSCNAGKHTC